MTHIIIKCSTGMLQANSNACNLIYDFMTEKGADHEDAANVAGWADLAEVGEDYELEGFEIYIV